MKRIILAAGVAALAITVPAAAKPGGGHDGGHAAKAQHGGGGGGHAKAARGGGKAHAQANRGSGKARAASRASAKQQRVAHAKPAHQQRMAVMDRHPAKARKAERRAEVKARGHAQARMAARAQRDDRIQLRNRADDRRMAFAERRDDRRQNIQVRNAFWTGDDNRRDRYDRQIASRGLVNGCPPGLFAKDNGCLPPGQARKLIGQRIPSAIRASALPRDLRDYYRDNDDYYYRYGDGYLYRVNRQNDLVSALMPLFGGGMALGTPFPSAYDNYYMPSAYSSFYPDSRDNYYRYANGYVYGVDRNSGLIDDIVPLLGGGYGVGQLMPASYSAYNLPYQYRGYYPDSSDAYYRYAPGAIYQVDPQTNLITSVASLLSPTGFAVGQQLPMGYSAYNVPLSYRDRYYDTPNDWYRYNNGSIYRVDPTTQLITAVISAIV